jgi:uncharacterized protein (TIGR00661 family)
VKKFNIRTILIAPLDWGLGHATRCIPIIKTLKNAGFNVIIACNAKQKKLLCTECDDVRFIDLEGYNIQYTKRSWFFVLKIIFQIPKIIASIKRENKWLNNIIEQEQIDLVISDNRYGLHSKKIPCVFITHQLTIKAPFVWLENLLQTINYSYINRFNQCWIPDNAGADNLAGLLSHPKKMPSITTQYIGLLNRFNKLENTIQKFDVCVLLSGPEPQRTIFENILLKQLNNAENLKIVFVRGLPQATEKLQTSTTIQIVNHLNQKDLLEVICSSEIIIARSGYTTVMELMALQKKSILIATPGQTEQEYLAKHLYHQQRCLIYNQADTNVIEALNAAKNFDYKLSSIEKFNENRIVDLVNDLVTDF